MKYLKKFATHSDYESYITGSSVAYPNVSVCEDEYKVHMTDVGEVIDPDAPTPPPSYSDQYLTFEFLNNGSISCYYDGISYSLDNGTTWNAFTDNVNVNAGDKMLFKGNVKSIPGSDGFCYFTDCSYNAYGNIMSVYDSENFRTLTSFENNNDGFAFFFRGTPIVSAENLILPATALTSYCYGEMFRGCRSLTTAPELPATTLASQCYDSMFYGCTSLNYIKCLATDISASDCTQNWVYDVASSGTFVKNPAMTSWSTGSNGIPTNWTVQNAS